MGSRRHFLRCSYAIALAALAEEALGRWPVEPPAQPARLSARQLWLPWIAGPGSTATQPQAAPPIQVYLPHLRGSPLGDMPLLAPASGTSTQAIAWLAPRAAGYSFDDVTAIIDAYARVAAPTGLDWFLALAQMAYETGHLTSWWSQRPRRNPAGIGVTGALQPGTSDKPPGANWAWDGTQWREGISFPSWLEHAIPAHLGRLLAYALIDEQATPAQRELIALALAYRPLPDSYRGSAPTICGLNGRWAIPGTTYGQSIVDLLRRMRDGV
jgi:hypothetical protein